MGLLKIKLNDGTYKLAKFTNKYSKFLYLTYFDGYDPTTSTDYPKIGNPVTYSVYNNFIPAIVNREYGSTQFPFLSNSTANEGNLWDGRVFDIDGSYDMVSCEWIESYPLIGSSSFGMPGGISVVNSSGIRAGFHGCLTNVVGVVLSDGNNTYNTWTAERSYWSSSSYTGYYRYYYPSDSTSLVNTNIHYAIVLNFAEHTARLYHNGNLVIIHNFSTLANPSYITFDPGYWCWSYQAYRTQFCILKGDHSINDGNNYPVPDEPYWKFA